MDRASISMKHTTRSNNRCLLLIPPALSTFFFLAHIPNQKLRSCFLKDHGSTRLSSYVKTLISDLTFLIVGDLRHKVQDTTQLILHTTGCHWLRATLLPFLEVFFFLAKKNFSRDVDCFSLFLFLFFSFLGMYCIWVYQSHNSNNRLF